MNLTAIVQARHLRPNEFLVHPKQAPAFAEVEGWISSTPEREQQDCQSKEVFKALKKKKVLFQKVLVCQCAGR